MVFSGFSLAPEVRWGIRSYSSVRVGGCAPLEIFGASGSGFDSATLHQCGLWPRQHHSGLARAVGHACRQCLFEHCSQNPVPKLLVFINQVRGVCAYRANKHHTVQYLAAIAGRRRPFLPVPFLSFYFWD